jgi:Co/Zn/Cd efflux system component
MSSGAYESIVGDLHRHGALSHAHRHDGSHEHNGPDRGHSHGHGHSHGLIDESIKGSREGIRAVSISLAVLGLAALSQTVVFIASGSVALLADLIHNFGDALTAVPLAVAFALRSDAAERWAGLAVVGTIFTNAASGSAQARPLA